MGASEPVRLADQECVPCRGDTPRLEGEALRRLGEQLVSWKIVEQHHLEKTFRFANFREALDFVNRIGEVAEQQNHHPDISLRWGRVDIRVYTHAIGGLSDNDFILAAKIDRLQ